jgi:hypothetical protein
MLLSYWFEIRSCDVTDRRARLPVNSARIRATRIAARSQKLMFLIDFLWHSGCTSYPAVQRNGRDLPFWERDVGRPQAVIKEDEICVETRFGHR